jgi:hypothetical protein
MRYAGVRERTFGLSRNNDLLEEGIKILATPLLTLGLGRRDKVDGKDRSRSNSMIKMKPNLIGGILGQQRNVIASLIISC